GARTSTPPSRRPAPRRHRRRRPKPVATTDAKRPPRRLDRLVQTAARRAGGVGLAAALALSLTLLLAPAAAGAATSRAARNRPVKLLAPRLGALVTDGVVRVRLRTPPAPASVSAELASHRGGKVTTRSIGRSFHLVAPGLRVATLRLGRQLALGENH